MLSLSLCIGSISIHRMFRFYEEAAQSYIKHGDPISIHRMFRFYLLNALSFSLHWLNFNTSYVSVLLDTLSSFEASSPDFNTSYVSVLHNFDVKFHIG